MRSLRLGLPSVKCLEISSHDNLFARSDNRDSSSALVHVGWFTRGGIDDDDEYSSSSLESKSRRGELWLVKAESMLESNRDLNRHRGPQ